MEENVPARRLPYPGDPAPIALFVHRRPEHVRRLLDSLAVNPLACRSSLYVFSDAPARIEQQEAVAQVRRLVHQFKGCAAVRVLERKEHFGLAASILAGVDQVLQEHDRVIVLEDDLELGPHFLDYVNFALERCQNDDQVMAVSGYAFPLAGERPKTNYFLPIISSWGWATWRRAWRHFDPQAQGSEELDTNATLRQRFDVNGSYPYSQLLRGQRLGRFDTWAVRWYWSVFQRGGLTLFPPVSQVRNRGWDGSGTHCRESASFEGPLADECCTAMPARWMADENAWQQLQEFFRRVAPTLQQEEIGIWATVKRWMEGLLSTRKKLLPTGRAGAKRQRNGGVE